MKANWANSILIKKKNEPLPIDFSILWRMEICMIYPVLLHFFPSIKSVDLLRKGRDALLMESEMTDSLHWTWKSLPAEMRH